MRIEIQSTMPLESEFDNTLDLSRVPPACTPGYLAAVKHDRRWEARFLVVRERNSVLGVVPAYRLRAGTLEADYRIRERFTEDITDLDCVLVGSHSGYAGSWLLSREIRTDRLDEFSDLLGAVLRDDILVRGVRLAFPYCNDALRQALREALGTPTEWVEAAHESVFRISDDIPSRIRGVHRRDQRMLAQHGVTYGFEISLDEVDPQVAEMIADHNVRLGTPDHPEFVAMRIKRWQKIMGTSVVVFHVESGGTRCGVLYGVHTGSRLDLLEIGLPENVPAEWRAQAYASLICHAPRVYCEMLGIDRVWCGVGSTQAKTSRGALSRPLYFGVTLATPEEL